MGGDSVLVENCIDASGDIFHDKRLARSGVKVLVRRLSSTEVTVHSTPTSESSRGFLDTSILLFPSPRRHHLFDVSLDLILDLVEIPIPLQNEVTLV